MVLQDAQVLVILNGGYEKLWETSDPPLVTPIISTQNAYSLSPDSLIMFGDKADVRQQISDVYNLSNTHTPDFYPS